MEQTEASSVQPQTNDTKVINNEGNKPKLNVNMLEKNVNNKHLHMKRDMIMRIQSIESSDDPDFDDNSSKKAKPTTNLPLHIMDPNLFVMRSDTDNKYPNLMTWFAMWNTMVGSGTFVIPYQFSKAGLIPGIITVTIVYLLEMYTCMVVVQNSKQAADYNEIVYKQGGNTLRLVWNLANLFILFVVSIIECIILCQSLYAFFQLFSPSMMSQDSSVGMGLMDISFTNWNILYHNILVFAIIAFFLFKRDTSLIVKIASQGAQIVMFSIIWFCYSLAKNELTEHITIDFQSNLVGEDPMIMIGLMLTGFLIHPCIMPIIRENQGFKQVNLNIIIGYTMVYLTYLLCGIVGYQAFQQVSPSEITNVLNVNPPTSFLEDVQGSVLRLMVSLQQITLIPLLATIGRKLLYQMIQGAEDADSKDQTLFNLVQIIVGFSVATLQPNLKIITNQSGSILGTIIAFVVPILVWFCKKQKKKQDQQQIDIKIYQDELRKSNVQNNFVNSMSKQEKSLSNETKHLLAAIHICILIIVVIAAAYNMQVS